MFIKITQFQLVMILIFFFFPSLFFGQNLNKKSENENEQYMTVWTTLRIAFTSFPSL